MATVTVNEKEIKFEEDDFDTSLGDGCGALSIEATAPNGATCCCHWWFKES